MAAKASVGGRVETLLISGEVLIGHVENRPRNATDIARHLHVPRATVVRKLALLERAGEVKQLEDGRYCYTKEQDEAALGYVDTALAIIRRAARR
jgi:DNA-binding IclR family transcriptional regulator